MHSQDSSQSDINTALTTLGAAKFGDGPLTVAILAHERIKMA